MIDYLAEVVTTTTTDVTWWQQWLTPAGIGEAAKNGGLVLLAWLFFTGKIITSKMHDMRVADVVVAINARIDDLIENHQRELTQKDAAYAAMVESDQRAYSEMKESRDFYRDARLQEQSRADRATDQLVENSEVVRTAAYLLESLSTVAAEGAAE